MESSATRATGTRGPSGPSPRRHRPKSIEHDAGAEKEASPTQHRAPLMNIDETARFLNTSPRFMRRLVQERRVPYLKVGRFIRFDPDEIDTWLDDCRRADLY